MFERPCFRALHVLVLLPLLTIGCGHEARLPVAVAPPNDLTSVAPDLDARDRGALGTMRSHGRRHLPPRTLIAEAKEALGAVNSGEQVHFQRWGTYVDVPETADFGVALGLDLGDLGHRWGFTVSGASVNGFVAKAEGRDDTDAEGITVTLVYQRGQPIVWTVQRRKSSP